MKFLNLTFAIFLLFIFSVLGLKIYRDFSISKDLKIEERNKSKKSAEVLNECFDLENKNSRTLNDSINLIEYCLEEYGYKKSFN